MKRQRIKKSERPDYQSMTGNMIKMGVGGIVGTAMIGATATQVAALPAGTAKTVAGIVPGLQATSLVGYNLGAMGLGKKKKKGSYY